MEVEADAVGDLVAALEQATLMAKQIATADPIQISQIHSALHFANHHLSQFLSQHQQFPLQPQRAILPALQRENSVSSAVGGVGGCEENGETGGGEPMQMGDDDEDEQNSRVAAVTVDKVEEKMRECFIQNKRPKRRLSPAAEPRRAYADEAAFRGGAAAAEYDPHGAKLRSLDLIYQFHA